MSIDGVSKLRIGGLATGIDTDQVISDLMKAERLPLDKLEQKRTLAEWRRDAYREITSTLAGFKSEFLDVLSSTNMRSDKMYKIFDISSVNSNTGSQSKTVSVSASTTAIEGNHTISVKNLATSEKLQSSGSVSSAVKGSKNIDWSGAEEKDFYLDIDGTSRKITVDAGVDSIEELQSLVDDAFGSGKIVISEVGGGVDYNGILKFDTVEGSGINKVTLERGDDDALDSLGFGTYANMSNRLNTSYTLNDLQVKFYNTFRFDDNDEVSLNINGEEFTFSRYTKLSSMMNEINSNESAGVNMRYDEVNDKFFFQSKDTGEGTNIDISENDSNFLYAINFQTYSTDDASAALQDYTGGNSKSFSVVIDGMRKDITLDQDYSDDSLSDVANDISTKINEAFGVSTTIIASDGKLNFSLNTAGKYISFAEPMAGDSALDDLGITANYVGGEDAVAEIDGIEVIRSSNSFSVEGINYTLQQENAVGEYEEVNLSLDVDKVFDNIKTFVEKYNEMLTTLNGKLSEEYDRNYQPLTDEQKLAMSDDDIELWEQRAKTGLLRNDSMIEEMVYSFRNKLYNSVEGVTQTLSQVGIKTTNYSDRGKLTIDEDTLKDAIRNDPDGVMLLFSQQSTTYSGSSRTLTSEQKEVRINEEGLAHRLFDVIEDNISIVSDRNGNKGTLLQKAGQIGDTSEFNNSIYDRIKEYDEDISNMLDRLQDKENSYYRQFSVLESMMSKMNSQGDWLMAQIGSM